MVRFRLLRTVSLLGLLCGGTSLLASPAAASGVNQTPVAVLDGLLAFLANPNVAYLLLVLGLLGLVAEVTTAGAVFPGVAGVICLLLSLYGLLRLPTNWLGLALIVAGIVMFVLDIKVAGFALTIGAAIAFALGSLLIYTPFWVAVPEQAVPVARLNPWLILGTTGGVTAFFLLGVTAAVKAQFRPVAVGQRVVIGKAGRVTQRLAPTGIVHVEGEEWSAVSATGAEIAAGAAVRVIGVEGLSLLVQPAEPAKSGA